MDRLYYWISEIISLHEFNRFIKQSLEDLISKFWCLFTCICEISLPLSITVCIHFYTLSKLFYFYSFVSIFPPFLLSLVLMDSSCYWISKMLEEKMSNCFPEENQAIIGKSSSVSFCVCLCVFVRFLR